MMTTLHPYTGWSPHHDTEPPEPFDNRPRALRNWAHIYECPTRRAWRWSRMNWARGRYTIQVSAAREWILKRWEWE